MAYVVEREFLDDADGLRRAYEAHWRYLRRLVDRGLLIGGGPWEDGAGEVLLLGAAGRESLRGLLDADPYVRARLVARERTREWQMALGCTAAGPAPAPAAGPALTAGGPRTGGVTGAALTPHERRIADMMLDGLTNRRIAESFSVSPRAVEQHITRIYQKLSIRRRAQLAAALHGMAPGPGAAEWDGAAVPALAR
ncbi:LuxR C-terminal-related transcriptional regulator [Streptomyces sp. NPDC092296]|uniref:LuxR C-terminal-related transcriptional regulator n=1 Tax=Streptomyces sp. NPDC092296 TaxID=3366012 RepID=UPI003816520D